MRGGGRVCVQNIWFPNESVTCELQYYTYLDHERNYQARGLNLFEVSEIVLSQYFNYISVKKYIHGFKKKYVCLNSPLLWSKLRNHHSLIKTKLETMDLNVLLITCLVTRAVHLDLVSAPTGEQFIWAFEWFGSLRRVPKVIAGTALTFTFVPPLVGTKVHIEDHKINNMLYPYTRLNFQQYYQECR